ncbi:MAG TPA: glycoside hydrolase family 88 protein [Steroidobacteraceae bacterium]|nr:glycoside hydrolase family 88 protein [Steroidobacteraceae bacterium]
MQLRRLVRAARLFAAVLSASAASAQSTPTQVHSTPQADPGVYSGRLEVDYPTPYEPATADDIRKVLERVHAYVDEAAPVAVVNGATGESVPDLTVLPPEVALARTDLQILTYEWGVTYAGMLRAAEITGDARYRDYTRRRLAAIATLATHARDRLPAGMTASDYPRPAHGIPLRAIILPRALDDAGAMCAALIKAELAGLGEQRGAASLRPWIDNLVRYVSTQQFRLGDGTLARNRPLPASLWLDDLYMSVPCLAQAGKLTGERGYYDDAAKQVLQFAGRMFVRERGLFMHGWVQGMQVHPAFHWARANGWALMAMAELLEVLPGDHPQRARILELFRAHAAGLIANQGHAGLWHQLLDRRESYEETSASAMFVFGIARGINRGWLDPLAFGPPASLGWNAVARKVNARGQVAGTCVGTGMGWDPMFYMYRPVHLLAAHGYGPVLLAGAEMIDLRRRHPDIGMHDGGVQFGRSLEN